MFGKGLTCKQSQGMDPGPTSYPATARIRETTRRVNSNVGIPIQNPPHMSRSSSVPSSRVPAQVREQETRRICPAYRATREVKGSSPRALRGAVSI